jgi:hypothetical protein
VSAAPFTRLTTGDEELDWLPEVLSALERAAPPIRRVRRQVDDEREGHPAGRHPATRVPLQRRNWLMDPLLSEFREQLEGLGFSVEGPPPPFPSTTNADEAEDEAEWEWEDDPVRLGWKTRRQLLPRPDPRDPGIEVDAWHEDRGIALIVDWDGDARTERLPRGPWSLRLDARRLLIATTEYGRTLAALQPAFADADLLESVREKLTMREVVIVDLSA